MPIKDKQLNNEYQREWARRRRAGLETKGIRLRKPPVPRTEEELKQSRLIHEEKRKKRDAVLKEKMSNLLGIECVICNSDRSLVAHEKHGTPHNGDGHNMWTDVFKRPEDFVRVCYSCHKGIHWVMEWFNMTWEEIISTIEANK